MHHIYAYLFVDCRRNHHVVGDAARTCLPVLQLSCFGFAWSFFSWSFCSSIFDHGLPLFIHFEVFGLQAEPPCCGGRRMRLFVLIYLSFAIDHFLLAAKMPCKKFPILAALTSGTFAVAHLSCLFICFACAGETTMLWRTLPARATIWHQICLIWICRQPKIVHVSNFAEQYTTFYLCYVDVFRQLPGPQSA